MENSLLRGKDCNSNISIQVSYNETSLCPSFRRMMREISAVDQQNTAQSNEISHLKGSQVGQETQPMYNILSFLTAKEKHLS